MRLFIAILLEQALKDQLSATAQKLEKQAVSGSFSKWENYHLTLVFIGETSQSKEIKMAMDAVKAAPFTLQIGGLGRFARPEGDIVWAGAKKSAPLVSLYEQLGQGLSEKGLAIENRPYQPHLTLGRKIKMPPDFFLQHDWQAWLPPMEQRVHKISLMKSERIRGELTYTELYARSLEP